MFVWVMLLRQKCQVIQPLVGAKPQNVPNLKETNGHLTIPHLDTSYESPNANIFHITVATRVPMAGISILSSIPRHEGNWMVG